MHLLVNLNTNYIFRWGLIILALLIHPYFLFPLILLFIVLFLKKKLQSIDLLLLLFLSFLVYGSLERLGSLANVRFLVLIFLFFYKLFKPPSKTFYNKNLAFPTLILLVYIFFQSLFVSNLADESILSLFEFALILMILYFSINFKSVVEFKYITENIYNLYGAVVLLSLIFLLYPTISYARNGVGFQGVTLHPNVFAIFIAPFCGFTLAQFISGRKKGDLLFFVLSSVSVVLSQSRTALLSIILGLILYLLVNKEFRQNFSRSFLIISTPLLLILLVFYNSIYSFFISFLSKNASDQNIWESLERSRGSLVDAQLMNISENFYWGIGFKIPSDKSLTVIEGTNSFAYEKGNIFLATFEELGVFGFALFILFLYYVVIRNRNNALFTIVPLILMFTNIGEATLFSMGGAGLFIWITILINNRMQTVFLQK